MLQIEQKPHIPLFSVACLRMLSAVTHTLLMSLMNDFPF